MRKLFPFLRPYRIPIVIALALTLVELAVELLHPYFMSRIIDDGIMQGDMSQVLYWGSIMIGFSLIAFAAGITNSFFAAHTSQGVGFTLRSSLFRKIQAFSFSNFSKYPTSSLITRMTNDVTQLQNTLFMSLRIMLRAPLLVIGSVVMAFIVNPTLALIFVVAVPLLLTFLLVIMKRAGKLFKEVQKRVDRVNGVVQENLAGMRLIKAFTRRNHENKKFTKASGELRDRTTKALRTVEITMPIILLIMNLSIMAVLWFGSFQVNTQGASVGEVVAIVNYATRMSGAMTVFSMIIMIFSRAKASSQRVGEVLEEEVDLRDEKDADSERTIYDGKIAFDRVQFHYPETETPVLRDLSFQVNPGEKIAIMGATGSGKSSLFQLIPRLYDVTGGTVFIDGRDIRGMTMERLRKQIGFVPQEAMLFTGSIKNNILWGKEDATMEEIVAAAKSAQIHDTIAGLPNGYETELGQKGVNLSGGQKQRLSIARALVRKPKILLLDDSTSALDMKTEARLLDAISGYDCTTMLITQKMSTTMNADKVLLLEDGQITAEGTHDELLAHSTLYQRIYASQLGEGGPKHA
ncbi:ABC transporter ATP-binding protein [Alteribacter natronophilus]|uniref:ABC transporter ATP-binding protein n=1 Tax=Alteribacter natronophilus TaxID=2583810 RepID=UPI00110E669F|nr:ABC transporter ATP-binding protein [Alteribacter natronophilus]TMW70732.1 ABC transporter ATP-binding protein [Alteribacter natronophilus]